MLTIVTQSRTVNGREIAVLNLHGSIDSLDALKLERQLLAILKQGVYDLVLDLTQIGFIGSSGWGVFVSKVGILRDHGGFMRFVSMTPDVANAFGLMGLVAIRNIATHPDVPSALLAYQTLDLV